MALLSLPRAARPADLGLSFGTIMASRQKLPRLFCASRSGPDERAAEVWQPTHRRCNSRTFICATAAPARAPRPASAPSCRISAPNRALLPRRRSCRCRIISVAIYWRCACDYGEPRRPAAAARRQLRKCALILRARARALTVPQQTHTVQGLQVPGPLRLQGRLGGGWRAAGDLLALTRVQDLGFKKGEMLTIESTSEDPNWWLANNAAGKRGMIPANYVVRATARRRVDHCVQELVGESVASSKSMTLPKDTSSFLLVRHCGRGARITRCSPWRGSTARSAASWPSSC